MIQSINAILISSANPLRLIDFYSSLGLKLKIANHGGGVHAETDLGGMHFSIQSGGHLSADRNNVSFSFYVPDLETAYETLLNKGIQFDEPPRALPFGGVIARLSDPDGNQVILMRWDSDKR